MCQEFFLVERIRIHNHLYILSFRDIDWIDWKSSKIQGSLRFRDSLLSFSLSSFANLYVYTKLRETFHRRLTCIINRQREDRTTIESEWPTRVKTIELYANTTHTFSCPDCKFLVEASRNRWKKETIDEDGQWVSDTCVCRGRERERREAREGRTRTGVEAVQAQYEAGLYQIISCHTDDDAAAELTPGLAFPVNAAAANQTHLPPFTLSSSVSSKPLFLLRPSFSVSQCRMALSPSFPSPRCLIVLRSILFHSFLLSLSIFLSLRFHTVTRQRCLFRFLSAHTEGSNERLRS